MLFQGTATALVTPFRNGEIDIEALRRLTRRQIEGGAAALGACGTTGEPATMTPDERETVVREVVREAAGRVPVIAGTGSNNTRAVVETARRYEGLGCAAQLAVTPYYNKTTAEGLYRHFMTIAEQSELPVVIYNVPSRTGIDLPPETLDRLCASERFAGLKESSYDIPFVMEKMSAIDGRMPVYSGNDDTTVPLMAVGAQGLISVASNVLPREVARMTEAFHDGEREAALSMQLRLMPLLRALFAEVNPIPVKAALAMLGLCENELRLPLVQAGDGVRAQLREALVGLGAMA